MGLFDWVKKKQEAKKQQEEENKLLREEVEKEISDEIIGMRKEKIKQEILAKERGEKTKSKGSEFFKKLGEEFKGLPVGGNEQMDRLIGKGKSLQNTTTDGLQSSDKISEMLGSKKSNDVTKKDIAGILGYNTNTKKDSVDIIGGSKVDDEKLKKLIRG